MGPQKRTPKTTTITCGHPGCGKTRTLRRTRSQSADCDGYMCTWEHGPPQKAAPGLVREIVLCAGGTFFGWRDVPPDPASTVAIRRAKRLELFAAARNIPRPRTDALLTAIAGPAGPDRDSILSFDDLSTGVRINTDGTVDTEHPHVAAALLLLLNRGRPLGLVLRTFTTAPVKELRGWSTSGAGLTPLSATELRTAHCTDADTGAPLLPEPAVIFRDAWPVDPGACVL